MRSGPSLCLIHRSAWKEEFSEVELPIYGVLRSSLPASNAQVTANIRQMGDVLAVARGLERHRYM
jgi:hypothetical protein